MDIFNTDPWEWFNFFTKTLPSNIGQLFADLLRSEQTLGLLIAVVGILVIIVQAMYERSMGREIAKHNVIVELLAVFLLFGIVTIFNMLLGAVKGIVY